MADNDPSKYSLIARCLQAASGAVAMDQQGKLCLINEEDEDLMEYIWEGSSLRDQDYIASGVKTNTPAAYLYQSVTQRLVFCVSETNNLKCYSFDAKTRRWDLEDLGTVASQELHPESGLCACINREDIRVYFQDTSGNLKGVARQNGTWKDLAVIQAELGEGTPLSVSFSPDNSTFYLYYMHVDGSLHYLTSGSPNGTWTDYAFPVSRFSTPVENFMAFRGEKAEEMEAYFLSAGKVFQIDKDGKRTELGSLKEDGSFEPNVKEQCYSICYIPVLVWNPCRPCWCW